MMEIWSICYLLSPLLVGLTFHGIVIRFGWLKFLVTPIDRGIELWGKPVFGPNKTWRGIVAIGFGTALGFAVQAFFLHSIPVLSQLELSNYAPPLWPIIGLLAGLAAAFSELPNSFIKRQLAIPSGGTTGGWLNPLFFALDQVDFLFGSWIVLAFVVKVTLLRVFYSFIFLLITHQIISILGYFLGMRKTAR